MRQFKVPLLCYCMVSIDSTKELMNNVFESIEHRKCRSLLLHNYINASSDNSNNNNIYIYIFKVQYPQYNKCNKFRVLSIFKSVPRHQERDHICMCDLKDNSLKIARYIL